jgi:hypothetical protein
MEVTCSSETLVDFDGLHDVISQKIEFFKLPIIRLPKSSCFHGMSLLSLEKKRKNIKNQVQMVLTGLRSKSLSISIQISGLSVWRHEYKFEPCLPSVFSLFLFFQWSESVKLFLFKSTELTAFLQCYILLVVNSWSPNFQFYGCSNFRAMFLSLNDHHQVICL